MDLSIIIVNWNTRELLRNCLLSIESHRANLEVQSIVVDNNSSDGSADMVAQCFPGVKLIRSGGNLGFARGNNLGLIHVEAPFVLFLNPDTEIRAQALERMLDFMRANPSVGALGCKIRGASGETKQLGLQWFPSPFTEIVKFLVVSTSTYCRLPRPFPYHDPEASGYVSKLYGACLQVRRSVLDQVGPFDERFFMYCEDVDLCRRITRAGWKLFYLSEAEILHLGGSASSKASNVFAVLMTCESLSKLMRKHYGRIGSAAYRVVTFLGAQARLLVLLCLKLTGAGGGRYVPSCGDSIRKYLAITKWCLGLEKPMIRN